MSVHWPGLSLRNTYIYNIISDSFQNFNQDKNLELVKFSNFAELWSEENCTAYLFLN